MSRRNDLLSVLLDISKYIESKLGGTVSFHEDVNQDAVIFRWKKYDEKTRQVLEFGYSESYITIDTMVDPIVIAQTIVDRFRNDLKIPENKEYIFTITFWMWGQKCTCIYDQKGELPLLEWIYTCREKGFMIPEEVKQDDIVIYSKEFLEKMIPMQLPK